MFYHLEDEKPVVLVVSEDGFALPNLIVDFLKSNSLETKLVFIDQEFFLKYKKLSEQKIRIHKIIFIFGFHSSSPDVYRIIFDFFELLFSNQNEVIPITMISSISTPLTILDDFGVNYQAGLTNKELFLREFFNKFSQNLTFLAQDLLIYKKKLDYPLLLFFSAFKQGHLLDPQAKLYFQDELSFFDLIKEHLIKPHHQAKFIIRGSAISSEKLLKKITYLYEQYFQKKLSIIKLFSDEKKQDLLQEFSVVSNSKSKIEDLIDQRIRDILSFDEEISSIAPSEAELAKAMQLNKLHKRWKESKQLEKEQFEKESQKIETLKSSALIVQADKEVLGGLINPGFNSEFIEKIEGLFSTQRKKEKTSRQDKNILQGKSIIKKTKKRKILFWFGIIGFSLASVFLSLFFVFNLSQKKLNKQLLEVVNNDGKNIESIDQSRLYGLFSFQLKQYEKILLEEVLTGAMDIKNLNNSLLSLSGGDKEFSEAFYNLYKKTLESGVDLSKFYEDLEIALDKKILAQKTLNSYLSSLNMELYQGEEKNIWQASLSRSQEGIKNSLQYKRFLTPFKNLLFQPGRTNILVVVQDSSELRSTGGFITDLILLSFNNGILIDKQILDANDIDSRIYGHKDADQEIKDLLGENVLYLRDSNWQVDFSKSSQEAQWFAEQVTGSKIDVTIALNTKTILEILEVIKEIKLDDGLSIDFTNFLDNQEKTASLDYKNISNGKFTWQFSNALLGRILNLTQQELSILSDVLVKNLNQREILIQSDNQNLKQAIEANSWSGQKIKVACPAEFKQDVCVLDFLLQVENNVGVNKINPYIRETIEHNIGISKDFIRHKRKVIFENFSRNNIWPLGSYKNYLKFYLNPIANLEKIEIDGKKVDDQRIKILNSEENLEIGILLEVPKQSRVEFVVTYLVPNRMELPFSYTFFDQKQAGIFAKNTSYNIVFEEQFKPQLIAPAATYQNRTIHFENDNSDHFFFAVDFSN